MSRSEVVRQRAGEMPPEVAFSRLPEYEQGAILAWIELSMVPARGVCRGVTSYGLKHDLENEVGFYVGNDAFKGAMLVAGFDPVRGNDLNWEFRIKHPYRRSVGGHTGFGVDRERLGDVEVALFDAIASWSRINVMFDNDRRLRSIGRTEEREIVREEDRQAFREARRSGLVGPPRIDREIYQAVTGDCHPPRPRRSVCA